MLVSIVKRKQVRKCFICGLLIINVLSMAGCSSRIGKQAGREWDNEHYQEAPGDSGGRNHQESPGESGLMDLQEPCTEKAPQMEEEVSKEQAVIPENIKAALLPGEVMLDWTQEASLIYALVHSEGNSKFGDTLLVLKDEDGAISRSYENDFQELMPWKIELADIDGDMEKEVLVAVKKTTPYDKVVKNRMFIFNFRDNVLVKKWTGSQIAGTWRDFHVAELVEASGEELIFLEQTEKGMERIKVYYWFDFGFFLLAESGEYTKVKELTVTGENKLQITLTDGQQINLTMKDGKLIET